MNIISLCESHSIHVELFAGRVTLIINNLVVITFEN